MVDGGVCRVNHGERVKQRPKGDEPVESSMTRLKLDELLRRPDGQFTSQVTGEVTVVDGSRDRLRWLLEAVATLGGELDLPRVLHKITEVAVHAVDADFGALAVTADARLSQFVAVSPHAVDLEEHPPVASVLSVPVVIRDTVFGTLYLSHACPRQRFTETDQALVEALACAAGVAIEDARLAGIAQRRLVLMSATSEVTTALLSGQETNDVLGLIARQARLLAGAEVAAICRPEGEDMVIAVADGKGAAALVGHRLGRGGSLPGRFRAGTTLTVGLRAADIQHGVLAIANGAGGPGFDDEERAFVEAFAGQASIALQLAAHQREAARLGVFEDRERIARDLHDLVIQQLFANGMQLASLAAALTNENQVGRVESVVDDLDATIRTIRSTIYALHSTELQLRCGPRERLLQATRSAQGTLGFVPSIQFEGAIDALVAPSIADHLVAVVVESLSNVAKHAHARHAVVTVTACPARVTLSVLDDGVGLPAHQTRSSGLGNLERRAAELGGSFDRRRPAAGGLEVIWSVPL